MMRRRIKVNSKRVAALPLLVLLFGVVPPGRGQQTAPTVPGNIEEMRLERRPTPAPVVGIQGPTVAAPEDFSKAQLLPGTLLSMDVYGVPDMSGLGLRVDAKGDVSVPTLGAVHLAGLTVEAAQTAIGNALVKAELLVHPVVQLNVVQFAASYVSVLGEVQAPGRFSMIGPRNLSEVLALAGVKRWRRAATLRSNTQRRKSPVPSSMFATRRVTRSPTCNA